MVTAARNSEGRRCNTRQKIRQPIKLIDPECVELGRVHFHIISQHFNFLPQYCDFIHNFLLQRYCSVRNEKKNFILSFYFLIPCHDKKQK